MKLFNEHLIIFLQYAILSIITLNKDNEMKILTYRR